MSNDYLATSKMLRTKRLTPYNSDVTVVLNIGLDEGSGDTFADLVTGTTITDSAGTVDHTTTPNAPAIGCQGELVGLTGNIMDDLTSGYLLCFYGSKPSFALAATMALGKDPIDKTQWTITSSNTTISAPGVSVTRTTLVNGQNAFFAVKIDIAALGFKVYDAVNLATPMAKGAGVASAVTENVISNHVYLGNTAFLPPTYGMLVYHSASDFTDTEMITFLDEFQNTWSRGNKHLIKGL